MRGRVYVAAAGVLTVLVVGACSHDSAGSSSTVNGGSAVGAGSGGVGPGDAAGAIAQAPTRLPAASAPQRRHAAGATDALLADGGRAVIRVAELTVAIRGAANVAAKADEADGIAIRAGGEVDADNRTSGRHASAALQFRVPPQSLQATLHALSGLGTELSRQLSTDDVIQQVADVASRVASAGDSIRRLRVLYANAQKVRDVIEIESELNTREADLESLQARQRSLARETSMATVNLTLVTAAAKKKTVVHHKPAKKRGGFVGSVERGWHGFTAVASWVADAVGTALPFLVLLAVLAAAARWAWPRRRAAAAPAPATTRASE